MANPRTGSKTDGRRKASRRSTSKGATSEGSRRIGIIGQGNVGSALERGLAQAGFEVRTSDSDPGNVRDVGEWAELLVLAVPYGARQDAIDTLGDAVEEKTVIDVTNALDEDYGFAGSARRSGAEELQDMAGSGACVVKAFNTVFADQMDKGEAAGQALTVFVAGDDPRAKREAVELAEAIGFDGVDAGDLANARWLETLGYLNIQLAQQPGVGRGGGFHFVHPKSRSRSPSRSSRSKRPTTRSRTGTPRSGGRRRAVAARSR